MLFQSLLIGLVATWSGGILVEYLCWIVNNPIIAGPLVGWLLGDFETGAQMGATLQLIYMGQITVGGVAAVDKCWAGVMGTAITILSHQTPEVGLTIAVTLGTLGLISSNFMMTANVAFVHMADKYIETGETKKIWIYNWLLPQFITIIAYGLPAFLCCYYGATAFEALMNALPVQFSEALSAVGTVLPALGIGMMLKAVYKPRFAAFAVIGFVLVAYLHLDIIACTLIGGAAAFLYWTLGLDKLVESKE